MKKQVGDSGETIEERGTIEEREKRRNLAFKKDET